MCTAGQYFVADQFSLDLGVVWTSGATEMLLLMTALLVFMVPAALGESEKLKLFIPLEHVIKVDDA